MDNNRLNRKTLSWEILLVLGFSLGSSAVYSIVAIINRLSQEKALNEQTATINRPLSEREIFDFIYQLLSFSFGILPVFLVLFLLWRFPPRLKFPSYSPVKELGFDFSRPKLDLGGGVLLAGAIGIPGLVLYLVGKEIGITVQIVASSLNEHWWTVPVLILAALKASLVEEVVGVGYLYTRLGQLGWSKLAIVLSTALFRGSYHLYQGIGPFFGNAIMGLVFGWAYLKWGRVMPLVVAHLLLDLVSFLGYPLALALLPGWF